MAQRIPDIRRVPRGLLRLARFRSAGLAEFGDTPNAFLGSLAPLLGFALAGTLLRLVDGDGFAAFTDFLAVLIAMLVPAVLIHAFARRWGREAAWLATATAFTWANWILLAALPLSLMAIGGTLIATGAPLKLAAIVAEFVWAAYGLSMHWFILRRGLGITRWRCALALGGIELGASVLIAGPSLLAALGDGAA